MTAITVSFSLKVATDWDPDAPLTSAKLNKLYDSVEHVAQWLGASYRNNAVQNHIHNGIDSALIAVGPNELRNPSFEEGTTNWTVTTYTGGTVAISTSNPLDGAKSLAFTSTVLANGGGDAISEEFLPVTGGKEYALNGAIKASVANVSAKMEIIWYDSAKAQISATTMYSSSNAPTALTAIGKSVAAPANARWRRVKITGCVPATGSATGTIYFDGMLACAGPGFVAAAGAYNACGAGSKIGGSTTSGTYVKVGEYRVSRPGVYTTLLSLQSTQSQTAYGRIYKNGVAVGTERSTTLYASPETFQEDISFAHGDLVQVYAYVTAGGTATAYLSLLEAAPVVPG